MLKLSLSRSLSLSELSLSLMKISSLWPLDFNPCLRSVLTRCFVLQSTVDSWQLQSSEQKSLECRGQQLSLCGRNLGCSKATPMLMLRGFFVPSKQTKARRVQQLQAVFFFRRSPGCAMCCSRLGVLSVLKRGLLCKL